MNYELSRLTKNHTDTPIEQTRTKPQEILDFELSKQMDTFSFNSSVNLSEKE